MPARFPTPSPARLSEGDYVPLIDLALREDLGEAGDITSQAAVPNETRSFSLWSKDTGVLAGEEVFTAVFRKVDPGIDVAFGLHDGDLLAPGVRVASVNGRTLSLLSAERTAINFIAFLTGIATAARDLVEIAKRSGNAVILDTRKTLPGFRALSKYAVSVGGGRNHRRGLYDMILVKDNHVDAAGSITAAVEKVRSRLGTRFAVEVECRSAEEVREALRAGVEIIMLDNMGLEQIRDMVGLVGGRAKVEASGNITRERIGPVSATGVDFISVGMLTHSVRSFDFSMKMDREGA